jgi:hypothetical protein
MYLKSAAALLIAGSLLLTSCIKNEYYTPEPSTVTPTGYQYIFDDNFNYDANNWSFSDPGNDAFVNISGGMLNYYYNPPTDGTNTVAVNTGASLRRDFLIQTRIRSDYAMGIAFGVSNNNYGYSLFIDEAGYIALYKEGDAYNGVQTIIDWKQSPAIGAGWNDVEFEQIGNVWVAYVNDTKIFEVPAEYISGNKIGFIVLAGTKGAADYLTVQW